MIPRDFLENFTRDQSNTKIVAAAAQIGPQDNLIFVNGQGTFTITLPPAPKCAGKFYYFYCTVDNSASVTVQDSDETADPYTSDPLTAVGDYILLYCTPGGYNWVSIAEKTT